MLKLTAKYRNNYIILSMIMAVILASLGLVLTKAKQYWLSEINYRMYSTVAISNICVAVYVMILVLYRFRKKGMNANIKQ